MDICTYDYVQSSSNNLKYQLSILEHERMSAGDPSHDHAICGGTTSLAEAQRQMALMAEIFNISLTNKTKHVRLGFANARSGAVDFTKPMKILSERCIVYMA